MDPGSIPGLKTLPLDALRSQRFPLDVYAYLARDHFASSMLHFGLFESPGEPLAQAQQRSNTLVDRMLRPAPAHVVEVGIGFGSTMDRLLRLGYSVTGITPETVQHEFVSRSVAGSRVLLGTFEQRAREIDSADVVLFQESAQYIQAEDLWSRCADLVGVGGQVLIVDEFRTGLAGAEVDWLPLLPEFSSAALRHGFAIRLQQDLGVQAHPTVQCIADKVREARREIEEMLQVSRAQIDALLAGLAKLEHDYSAHQVTYALLDFRRC